MKINLLESPFVQPLAAPCKTESVKGKCGVYAIINRASGRLYVGSSFDLGKRFHQHRGSLRRGTHKNSDFQKEYDSAGEHPYVFAVTEFCDRENVRQKEDEIIRNNFNGGALINARLDADGLIREETRRRLSAGLVRRWASSEARAAIALKIKGKTNGAKPFRLVDPSGKIVEGKNRAALCREYMLDTGSMTRLAKGQIKQAYGWTLPKD